MLIDSKHHKLPTGETLAEELTDNQLRRLLKAVNTFACVGVSAIPIRPSYFVGRYLNLKGYKVVPVNPAYAGSKLFGGTVCASIDSVENPDEIDVLDIFRRPEEVPKIVISGLSKFPNLKVVWMQIGIRHEEAAALARDRGIIVIQNRCPKIEYQRLFGELRMAGFNTGVISSRI